MKKGGLEEELFEGLKDPLSWNSHLLEVAETFTSPLLKKQGLLSLLQSNIL